MLEQHEACCIQRASVNKKAGWCWAAKSILNCGQLSPLNWVTLNKLPNFPVPVSLSFVSSAHCTVMARDDDCPNHPISLSVFSLHCVTQLPVGKGPSAPTELWPWGCCSRRTLAEIQLRGKLKKQRHMASFRGTQEGDLFGFYHGKRSS